MKKLIIFYDNDGFTVIELLMAIIILGVVMAAITTMIVQSFNVFDSSTRRMSAGQLAELALSEVGGYLRSATDVTSDGNIDDNNKPDGPWKFKGYHLDNEDEIVMLEFNLVNKSLQLKVNDIEKRIILNNVEEFDISTINGNEFEIFIKVEDGDENIAEKRLNISSRNLQFLQE